MDDAAPGGNERSYIVNLFPYAAPVAAHARVLQEILKAPQRTHLLILSRTAHPGLVLAGRAAGLKVIALADGVSKHSLAHGQALLKSLLTAEKMAAARELLGTPATGQKRLRGSDLQFQVLAAPEEQPIRIRDVEPSPESAWRAGFNKSPANLDQKAIAQLQAELDRHDLTLERKNGSMYACTRKPLRDGDVVCAVAGLTFDSFDKLRSCLNSNEHAKEFLGSLVRIDNVKLGDDDDTGSIYHMMTGIGRYFRHYQSLQKQPNIVLQLDLSRGAGDGLVSAVVRTRNKCGIAQGSPLLLNFGMEYDHAALAKLEQEEGQEPKRLRGLLEQFFKKLGDESAAAEASAAGSSAAAAAAGSAAVAAAASPPAPSPAPQPDSAAATAGAGASAATATAAGSSAGVSPAGSSAHAPSAGSTAAATGSSAAGSGEAGAPEASAAAGSAAVSLRGAERIVGEISEPFKVAMIFQPSELGKEASIRLSSMVPLTGNKKIPPNKIFVHSREGQVERVVTCRRTCLVTGPPGQVSSSLGPRPSGSRGLVRAPRWSM